MLAQIVPGRRPDGRPAQRTSCTWAGAMATQWQSPPDPVAILYDGNFTMPAPTKPRPCRWRWRAAPCMKPCAAAFPGDGHGVKCIAGKQHLDWRRHLAVGKFPRGGRGSGSKEKRARSKPAPERLKVRRYCGVRVRKSPNRRSLRNRHRAAGSALRSTAPVPGPSPPHSSPSGGFHGAAPSVPSGGGRSRPPRC